MSNCRTRQKICTYSPNKTPHECVEIRSTWLAPRQPPPSNNRSRIPARVSEEAARGAAPGCGGVRRPEQQRRRAGGRAALVGRSAAASRPGCLGAQRHQHNSAEGLGWIGGGEWERGVFCIFLLARPTCQGSEWWKLDGRLTEWHGEQKKVRPMVYRCEQTF